MMRPADLRRLSPELRELVARRLEVAKRRTRDGKDIGGYIARATAAGVADHPMTCSCEKCARFWGP